MNHLYAGRTALRLQLWSKASKPLRSLWLQISMMLLLSVLERVLFSHEHSFRIYYEAGQHELHPLKENTLPLIDVLVAMKRSEQRLSDDRVYPSPDYIWFGKRRSQRRHSSGTTVLRFIPFLGQTK
jgi:hypothetical protein